MKHCVLSACLLVVATTSVAGAPEAWPEFRGPTGQGIAGDATPPLEWSGGKNVVWKQTIPGQGWSSPVVAGDAVFLTTALESAEGDLESLRAVRVNVTTGDIDWNVEVFPWSGEARKHTKNGHASPTPIVEGDRIYVHFGPMGTACLSTTGDLEWRQEGLAYETPHGNGGSPALSGDKLIYSCDDMDRPFVVALEKATGRVAWKAERQTDAASKFSFSTPLVIEENGRRVAISPGSGAVCAYDVETGKEIWRFGYGEGFSVVPRPVHAHGLIFVATGFAEPCSVLAIRTGGTGDVSDTHLAWRLDEDAPHTPSMLSVGGELYFVSDRGTFSCVDAKTGEIHWQEKVRDRFSASPVYADGRIYITSEKGVTYVIAAGKEYQSLAENDLGERTFASPAVVGNAIYMRTESSLYRIEAP